jgi:hypothetical protein
MTNKTKIAGLVGAVMLLCGAQAHAEITWRFDSNPNSGYTTVNSTTAQKISDGVTATAQAWSNTNNGIAYPSCANLSGSALTTCVNTQNSSLGSNTSTGSQNYTLETAYLTVYDGGIGVKNRDASSSTDYGDKSETGTPEHSTDNQQRYDSVLFSFTSAIDLNSVKIGYGSSYGYDTDISVLAYTGTGSCAGSGTCTSDIAGKTYAQLTSFGWSLIGHYANLVDGVAKDVNAGNVTSSYWLVGALNPLVSNNTVPSGMAAGNDYVKILALAGETAKVPPSGVPEPGTLLLMGAGLWGLSRFNARRPVRCAV